MANWKERTAMYEVHEISGKNHEVYALYMTGKEIREYCKSKYEMNGYIDGMGGSKQYACWAVEIRG